MPTPLNAVFMGSDSLSCTFLTALIHTPDIDVAAVFTQPDKERGRHMKVTAGPVKDLAHLHRIPVSSPEKLNTPETIDELRRLNPDIIVVMAYGQFLGTEILTLPRLGCLNLHVSILPLWRGAAPIQHAILNGDTETGVTAMMMDKGMDTGDILGVVRQPISADDTTGSLQLKMAAAGSVLMIDTIRALHAGTATRVPQEHAAATYAPKIRKESGFIEWTDAAPDIDRLVRALNPKPVCGTFLPNLENPNEPGPLLKIYKTAVEPFPARLAFDAATVVPGTILTLKHGPLIATGDGMALRLLEVLPEGRPKPMTGVDFSNGHQKKLKPGDRLFPGLKSILS